MTEDQFQRLIEGQAETRQAVKDLQNRLFGNGQPGVIQHIHTQLSEKAELDAFQEVKTTAAAIDRKVNWILGVGCASVFLITVVISLLGLFHKLVIL
jgi:hypothetical protein